MQQRAQRLVEMAVPESCCEMLEGGSGRRWLL